MKQTSRIRVLSNRIPRVLMFVYFCRGLSGNTKERPTCRVYIEILTCRAIFYHLEDSRNEAEAERGLAQGARPRDQGSCPPVLPNQSPLRGSCSTDLKDQGSPFNQCQFDPTVQIHLRGLYNQTLWTLEENKFIIELRGALEGIPLL